MAAVIDINLISARRAQRQRRAALLRLSVYGAGALVLGMGVALAWLITTTRVVRSQINECEARLQAPDLLSSMARLSFLDTQVRQLTPRVNLLTAVHDSEGAWIRMLQDLSRAVPSDVWITSLGSQRSDKEQRLMLKGSAPSQRAVGDFMLQLRNAPWCQAPALVQTQVSRGNGQQSSVIEYEMALPLVKPVGGQFR